MQKQFLRVFFTTLVTCGALFGQFDDKWLKLSDDSSREFPVSSIADKLQIIPGENLTVAVEIRIEDGWVYYAPSQTENIVIPAGVEIASGNLETVEVKWSKPELKLTDLGDRMAEIPVYKHSAWAFVVLKAPDDAKPGEETLTLAPTGQICSNVCRDIPDRPTKVTVKIGDKSLPNPKWTAEIAEKYSQARTVEQIRNAKRPESKIVSEYASWSIGWALVIAFIAGLTLNIMPCVLPIIPLRVLSVVQMAGHSRRRFVTMGLAFAFGIWAFFVVIAAINVVLKLTIGRAIDINEGFQHSGAIVALSAIFVILSANLFGLFDVNVPGSAGKLETKVQSGKAGHLKSLAMGFMLAILATPCSFAFLAAALAYAQTASILNGTLVIAVIGFAMALPHFILATMPRLVELLPRPGRWMELFRQGCGFAILGAVVWLVSTLGGEDSVWAFRIAGWLVVLCFGAWMWGHWVIITTPFEKRVVIRLAALVIVAGSGYFLLAENAKPKIHHQPFDVELIDKARAAEDTVIVKFSARWCLECLHLENSVYENPKVVKAIESSDRIKLFVGDITRGDTPAAKWMQANGYGSRIPLTIIYKPGREPIVVVGGYSAKQFLEWIE